MLPKCSRDGCYNNVSPKASEFAGTAAKKGRSEWIGVCGTCIKSDLRKIEIEQQERSRVEAREERIRQKEPSVQPTSVDEMTAKEVAEVLVLAMSEVYNMYQVGIIEGFSDGHYTRLWLKVSSVIQFITAIEWNETSYPYHSIPQYIRATVSEDIAGAWERLDAKVAAKQNGANG